MKRRVLNIHRISEEQLRGLMHVAQGLRLRSNNYFIIAEDIDWYIVLYVLFEQQVIHKGQRPPYTAFEKWTQSNVTLYNATPNAYRLSVMARRITADATLPWESKHAPKYAVRKWQALYHYFTQMVRNAIELHE
jgi:hypothetical protein